MAGASSVLEDTTMLSRMDRGLFKIETLFALFSGLAIFSLMVLAVYSVGGRNFFNEPMPGYVDWIEQIMSVIAFLGIAYCHRLGGHIRMDIFVGALKGRALMLFELISTTAMFLLIVLLVWGSWSHFERSFDWNQPLYSTDSSIDIALPIWPAKILVPIAFGLLALRLALHTVTYAKALWTGEDQPAGVPLIEDAATQAENEAASVSGFETEER